MSCISLTKKREAEIQTNFSCEVEFYYPADEDEFDAILEELKSKSRGDEETADDNDYETNVNNVFWENLIRDRLIVFDNISGLAANSKKFASFLTVTRKYNYNCIYIFHTIFPEKANWQTILSQTIIYIFPATVPLNSVRKILEGACIRKTSKYIPQASL